MSWIEKMEKAQRSKALKTAAGIAVTKRSLAALVSAGILWTSPLLLSAVTGGLVITTGGVARAQSAEAVAKIAESITVRIEGATQGSGVLVKREGNRYTVLTAWHVVQGQRAGEELAIYTADGVQHMADPTSIRRLGSLDLAEITFSSTGSYRLGRIERIPRSSAGSPIYVAGYPNATPTVPIRIWRFSVGTLTATPAVTLPDGYNLLYTNQTTAGMSGGPVLDDRGMIIGIHGRAETEKRLLSDEVFIKTGTSQGVPLYLHSPLGDSPLKGMREELEPTATMNSLAEKCGFIKPNHKRTDSNSILNSKCEELNKLSIDLAQAFGCEWHEAGIVNMNDYSKETCNSSAIRLLRDAQKEYPHITLVPILFPQGAERVNPSLIDKYKEIYNRVFDESRGADSAARFIDEYCKDEAYMDFARFLKEGTSLGYLSKLYTDSCAPDSFLRYFAPIFDPRTDRGGTFYS